MCDNRPLLDKRSIRCLSAQVFRLPAASFLLRHYYRTTMFKVKRISHLRTAAAATRRHSSVTNTSRDIGLQTSAIHWASRSVTDNNLLRPPPNENLTSFTMIHKTGSTHNIFHSCQRQPVGFRGHSYNDVGLPLLAQKVRQVWTSVFWSMQTDRQILYKHADGHGRF